ncbi:hypothetical protein DFH06DRAFT_325226 [Mycena polygramma]|nr:hypothetical protein DFH06DRAFT_325226 [Mycena polygramma]
MGSDSESIGQPEEYAPKQRARAPSPSLGSRHSAGPAAPPVAANYAPGSHAAASAGMSQRQQEIYTRDFSLAFATPPSKAPISTYLAPHQQQFSQSVHPYASPNCRQGYPQFAQSAPAQYSFVPQSSLLSQYTPKTAEHIRDEAIRLRPLAEASASWISAASQGRAIPRAARARVPQLSTPGVAPTLEEDAPENAGRALGCRRSIYAGYSGVINPQHPALRGDFPPRRRPPRAPKSRRYPHILVPGNFPPVLRTDLPPIPLPFHYRPYNKQPQALRHGRHPLNEQNWRPFPILYFY